jgi:glucuronate isomerase
MPVPFLSEDFLLETDASRELYHRYAEHLPIIDYHCHLSAADIAEDRHWENITQVWLGGDHYKWRAMRTAGVAEKYCTGAASDWEKFEKFAAAMPRMLRNPLYHWSHLELKRYFGVAGKLLNAQTAGEIYEQCNTTIRTSGFSARGLLKQSRVEVVCTTNEPNDSLEHHIAIRRDSTFEVQVRPTWRPDRASQIDRPTLFVPWVDRLAEVSDSTITTLTDFLGALRKRHDFFHANGCLLSDRGLRVFPLEECGEAEAARIFSAARAGKVASREEAAKFQSFMLHEFAVMDAEKNWTMQIHYGSLPEVNSRKVAETGPRTGFDSIGDWPTAEAMGRYFDRLERIDRLPRTIIYNLNPSHNEVVASMIGNFQNGITPGKMQFGSGWWFLDQLDGMRRQIDALSQLGLLSEFVGMLTDSRSFLSYVRHEYFRRLLCDILGSEIEDGRLPHDLELIGQMVTGICYTNARKYFGFYL